MLGKIIDGRYELVRKIGRGGMGTVYAARHTTLEKMVALKLLSPEWRKELSVRAQMITEAKAAARIRHDNVVNVVHVGETREGDVYIVMELLEGVDLETILTEEGPLDLTRAQALLVQISGGLAAAHAKRVVHRDIKPANCFVESVENEDGDRVDRVKVLDFGIAKITEGSNETAQVLTSTRPWGTRRYIAPEVLDGEPSRPASDVFSFGTLAYRMLTGHFPYRGGSVEITPFEKYRSDIPYHLRDLILAMLQREPAGRPQTMAEVNEALKHERRRRKATQSPAGNTDLSSGRLVPVTEPGDSTPTTSPLSSSLIDARERRSWKKIVVRWTIPVTAMAIMPLLHDYLPLEPSPLPSDLVVVAPPHNSDARIDVIPEIPTEPSRPSFVHSEKRERTNSSPMSPQPVPAPEGDALPDARAKVRRSPKRDQSSRPADRTATPTSTSNSTVSQTDARRWSVTEYDAWSDNEPLRADKPVIQTVHSAMRSCSRSISPLTSRLEIEFMKTPKKVLGINVTGSSTLERCLCSVFRTMQPSNLPEGRYKIKIEEDNRKG